MLEPPALITLTTDLQRSNLGGIWCFQVNLRMPSQLCIPAGTRCLTSLYPYKELAISYNIYIYRVVYGSFIRRLAIGIRNGYCRNIAIPEVPTSASFWVRVARGMSNGSCRSRAAMTRVPWFLVEQLHKIWAFHSPKLGILRVSATMAGDGTNQTEKNQTSRY